MKRISAIAFSALFILALPLRGAVVQPELLYQFRATDAQPGDEFGWSVAMDGRFGIVGAPARAENGLETGAAYLFDVQTREQLHKFLPADAEAGDRFGTSVAIDGNYAVVGSLLNDAGARATGSAYVFDVSTGQQLFKLTAADGSADDEFGVSVAVQGDVALVGAHKDDVGSAYFFDLTSGQQVRKVTSSDGDPQDLFGVAVALDGDNALIGARYDDDHAIASGAAYLFDVASATERHKLTPFDGDRGDRYGMYVDLQNNRAVVGSRYDDDAGKSSGSAYIYEVETGDLVKKILPDDLDSKDQFGSAIAIDDGLLVVGAVNDSDLGNFSGSAYLFDVETGDQLFKLVAPDAHPLDLLGQSAAIDQGLVLVGAPMLDYPGAPPLPSGKVYVWSVPEPTGGLAIIVLWATIYCRAALRQSVSPLQTFIGVR